MYVCMLNYIKINSYGTFRQDRVEGIANCKSRGGGIIVYLKDVYKHVVQEMTSISRDIAHLWVLITTPKSKPVLIGVVCRPPEGSVKHAMEALNTSMMHIENLASAAEIIILGDFNIDYRKVCNADCKALKSFEQKHNLLQLIQRPTRVTNKVKSMIDLIFVDMSYISESGVLLDMIADQFPIYLIKKKTKNLKAHKFMKGRTYKRYHPEIFQEMLINDCNWVRFWAVVEDPNIMWEIMLEIIINACDKLCLLVNIKLREDVPAYITAEFLDLITQKTTLSRTLTINADEDTYMALKNSRKELRKSLERAKTNSIMSTLDENRNDPRKFWREINSNFGIGKHKNSSSCTQIKSDTGEILQYEAVGNLSNYYAQNGTRLAEAFQQDWDDGMCNIDRQKNQFHFGFIPMNIVQKLLKGRHL